MSDLTVLNIKPFVGAKDFDQSLAFYKALGWQIKAENDEITELQLGNCGFFLQDYYQKAWCENMMLHLAVDDARRWFEHTTEILRAKQYGLARVQPPKRESYGALVTYVWDPAGVLLHLAQFDPA